MQFDIERPTIGLATLTGPVPGAPNTLAQGRWLLGLAQTFSSDFGTCDSPCSSIFFESGSVLLCDTALEVESGTLAVRVRANFGEECSIAVDKLTAADASSLPLAQPVPVHSALLVVHGKGKCSIINYGSCQFVLLLTQDPTDLSTWQPGSDDLEFEQKALSFYAAKLTGAPPGLPSTIASGHWYVGLAVAQNSDVESEGRWGDVQCQTEFDVTGADDYALIKADYGPPCTVTAEIGPPPGS